MYPNLLPLIFFSIAAAFTPGPNNIVGSYSGFNFGIKKSLPLILGAIEKDGKVVLLHPSQKVENGLEIA